MDATDDTRIVHKPGEGSGFAAEGETGGTRFRTGVGLEAVAAAPVR